MCRIGHDAGKPHGAAWHRLNHSAPKRSVRPSGPKSTARIRTLVPLLRVPPEKDLLFSLHILLYCLFCSIEVCEVNPANTRQITVMYPYGWLEEFGTPCTAPLLRMGTNLFRLLPRRKRVFL